MRMPYWRTRCIETGTRAPCRGDIAMTSKSPISKLTFCPQCGAAATGKFCIKCGTPLRGASCPSCGSQLQTGAKFCHNCAHRLGGSRDAKPALPWIFAAAAAVVLIIVVLTTLGPSSPLPTALPTAFTPQRAATPSTPRGEADALFERAMTAFENGDSSQAAFSGQMALNAYALLNDRDPDSHFHIGLLLQIKGDLAAMLAQADTIERLSPGHLFAPMLRHRVARMSGDEDLARRSYTRFLEHYDGEIVTNRFEYTAHSRLIESFRTEARQAVGM